MDLTIHSDGASMKNRVAVLLKPGEFVFNEDELPSPRALEVVIKVTVSGICSSEIPFFTGESVCSQREFVKYARYPAPLGHEVAGVVYAIGSDVAKFKIGDRVTGFTVKGSGFCTYYTEEERNLVNIPDNVPNEHALGEVIMCIANIARACEPELGDCVVLVGDGFMGLMLVSILSRYPLSQLILVGASETKLKIGSKFGATHCININHEDPYSALEKLLGVSGADITVDLAGNMSALTLCAWAVKPRRGKLVIPSYYSKKEPFEIGGYLMRKGPRMIPVHPAYSLDNIDDLRRGIWALEKGILPMDSLITHRYGFEDLKKAFQEASMKKEDYIKGIIVFDQGAA